MKTIAIIGGGIAGLTAATELKELGYDVILIEKQQQLGGHLNQWDRLFPNFRPAAEVLNHLKSNLESIKILIGKTVKQIAKTGSKYTLELIDNTSLTADAVLIATGFDLFDANRKEEYGYGIFDNVITSPELEQIFKENKPIVTTDHKVPRRIGIIHCVGSRDEKVGNTYCSKVCCVTAVKQAIEIKEKLGSTEVYCFYMDLRMFDLHFENLYRIAQEKHGIQFIRGRLSEANENIDGSLLIKFEDTLTGRPAKLTVDLLVLMVGIVASSETKRLANMLNIKINEHGFFQPDDAHLASGESQLKGVFFTGTATSPKTIEHTVADARSTALEIHRFLKSK